MQPTIFQLNDEHRSRIRDCLWKQGIWLSHEADKNFARDVECSIVTFLKKREAIPAPHIEKRTMRCALCGKFPSRTMS